MMQAKLDIEDLTIEAMIKGWYDIDTIMEMQIADADPSQAPFLHSLPVGAIRHRILLLGQKKRCTAYYLVWYSNRTEVRHDLEESVMREEYYHRRYALEHSLRFVLDLAQTHHHMTNSEMTAHIQSIVDQESNLENLPRQLVMVKDTTEQENQFPMMDEGLLLRQWTIRLGSKKVMVGFLGDNAGQPVYAVHLK